MKLRVRLCAMAPFVFASAAFATDLSLFEREAFRGRQLMLRAATPDLADVGYQDAVASLVVRTGRWELCTEPAFKGHCAVFPQGEYRLLHGRFNGRVGSARPLSIP
jgi:hypothetical protein